MRNRHNNFIFGRDSKFVLDSDYETDEYDLFVNACGIDYYNALKKNYVMSRKNGRKDYLKLHLATAMLSYIGCSEGFVDGFNLVEDCNDAEQYKEVLEMIFDKLGQKQHFNHMTAKRK